MSSRSPSVTVVPHAAAAHAAVATVRSSAAVMPSWLALDPLEDDGALDRDVLVSRRGLVRRALVASETGSRFQRDGVAHDPMAWLMAPRVLFDGATAMDACVDRDACLRAVLLHGLGLGLDADPAALDDLLYGDGDDTDRNGPVPSGSVGDGDASDGTTRCSREGGGSPRLYTSVIAARDAGGTVQAFDAAVLPSEQKMRLRIARRLGDGVAARARIERGFVPSAISDAFVTDALGETLRQVEADPASPLAAGLDVVLQQRFAA